MATLYSILAWEIPWTEEPGGLQSTGSHRVGHDLSDLARVLVTGKWGELFGRKGGVQFLSGSRDSDQRWLGMVARPANMELGKKGFRPSLVTSLHDFRLIS